MRKTIIVCALLLLACGASTEGKKTEPVQKQRPILTKAVVEKIHGIKSASTYGVANIYSTFYLVFADATYIEVGPGRFGATKIGDSVKFYQEDLK